MPKDFLSLADWSGSELLKVLERAVQLKTNLREGKSSHPLNGKSVAMYFEHPSLRTHVTFQTGISQLGGNSIFLTGDQVGIGKRESVSDVARSL